MPKKSSATARRGAQRNRPKVQKNIQLVRASQAAELVAVEEEKEVEGTEESVPVLETAELDASDVSSETIEESVPVLETAELDASDVSSETIEESVPVVPAKKKETPKKEVVAQVASSTDSNGVTATAAPVKGSASARLAARRQQGQKTQQRAAASLITAEHYAYVKRDLIFIAILAIIMFSALIVLHFVPGIGS
jgi:hypothetical protein